MTTPTTTTTTTTTTTRVAPWTSPSTQNKFITGLKLVNSITNIKEDFIPQQGKRVKWYICGPTVYDSSHMGHARNYISFDIIRRILEDYFGYELFCVMNITDIDDKIIIQARKNYFFDQYKEKNKALLENVRGEIQQALDFEKNILSEKINALNEIKDKNIEETSTIKLYEEKLNDINQNYKFLAKLKSDAPSEDIINQARSSLSEWLDDKYSSTIDGNLMRDLVKQHSLKYEIEYMGDMKDLGVKLPDVLTRVSEYINEIIEMVTKIINNGYAYESNGSVYFNTETFNKGKHFYAKLCPQHIGKASFQSESEGKLTNLKAARSEKKNPNDFALWKKSKEGEPIWDSPWGQGRPGWHIECSAMAGSILGDVIDVHSGGVDLKFPHHDNEMAQSEAYFDNEQWVNYFLHSGHLHISGLKMSKSLKNFITIREVLDKYNMQQIRMLFLLQSWDGTMNYKIENPMGEADVLLQRFKEFFLKVETAILFSNDENDQSWSEKETKLHNTLLEIQSGVDLALKDNFDTPKVMLLLAELLTESFTYIKSADIKRVYLIQKVANFVTKILKIFGIIDDNKFGFSSNEAQVEWEKKKKLIFPYVKEFASFRTKLRQAVLKKKMEDISNFADEFIISLQKLGVVINNGEIESNLKDDEEKNNLYPILHEIVVFYSNVKEAISKSQFDTILKFSDDIRDNILPKYDIQIADDSDFPFSLVKKKKLSKQEIEIERGKLTVELTGYRQKLGTKENDLKKYLNAVQSVHEYMLSQNVVLNEDGSLPEKDKDDKPLGKRKGKLEKIKKSFETQKKKLNDNPNIIQNLEAEIVKLISDIEKTEVKIKSL